MLAAGATKLCFIISPGKSDILQYYGGGIGDARICYLVQRRPAGLCDAIFQARTASSRRDEPVIVGLPDTLWFPIDGLRALPMTSASFLLFPVEHPELFDAVRHDEPDGARDRDSGQAADADVSLGVGRVQDAGRGASRAARSLAGAATRATSTSARW